MAQTQWQITERTLHSQTWEASEAFLDPASGKVITQERRFVELASGLNFWDVQVREFRPTREQFQITADGYVVATEGPHKLIVENNINSDTALDCLTSDGVRLRSGPLAIAFFDPVDGRNQILATIRDTAGELTALNEITFKSCFEGLDASIRITYRRAGYSQDLLLHEAPPDPEALGLSQWSRLELYSVFMPDTPAPRQTQRMLRGETALVDSLLDFGEYKIITGRAFEWKGEPLGPGILVAKAYQIINDVPTLIESIEYGAAKHLFAGLPKAKDTAVAMNPSPGRKSVRGDSSVLVARAVPRRPPANTSLAPIQRALARLERDKSGKAFCLDYSLVSGATNFTFRGDSTYFVSSESYLYGKTVFENAVIKYTNAGFPSLQVQGEAEFKTGPYRPLICTSQSDDSVGESLPWSTGNPFTNYCANPAIEMDYYPTGTLASIRHIRISHARAGLSFYTGYGHVVEHAQFIRCDDVLWPYYAEVTLRNSLVYQANEVFDGSITSTCRVEHLTAHIVNTLAKTNTTVYLTNSLLIAVTNLGSFTSANNATNSSDTGVFATVGAGTHYLASGSSYRNQGTTNVAVLSDLRQRTTFAPYLLTNTITVSTNLMPVVPRDTDTPDLGWHFPAVDFAANCRVTNNATVTITPGTVIAGFSNAAIWLQDGSKLICEGAPLQRIQFVRYTAVQEQSTNWGGTPLSQTVTIASYHWSNPAPAVQLRFTDFNAMSGEGYHLYSDAGSSSYASLAAADCSFNGATVTLSGPDTGSIGLTNNLFERVHIGIQDNPKVTLYNNMIKGGDWFSANWGTNVWVFKDNVFDSVAVLDFGSSTTNSNTGYINMSDRLSPTNVTDIVLSNFTFVSGPLGNYYQGANLLTDKGSRTADQAGLFHYTTKADTQMKEGFSIVDLGIHYPQLTPGTPIVSTNMALNGSVSQSSTNSGGDPNRAVDGNTDGTFNHNSVTHTSSDAQAWWQIDLGSVKPIEIIRLWNRTDCCDYRLTNSFVLISDNPFTSTNLATSTNQAGVTSLHLNQVGTLNVVPVYRTGRYVRVQLSGTNYLQLAEVEAMSQTVNSDVDGDGVWDYQEDSNGNGLQDGGETDWQTVDSGYLPPFEPIGPCSRRTPLVISEIMYRPATGQNEFIELYNTHHLAQNISGYKLTIDAAPFTYTFSNNTIIQPGALLNVNFTNKLHNDKDKLRLLNAAGAVLLEINYEDKAPWPVAADGTGHSLVLARPSYGENDARAWAASDHIGGSPSAGEIFQLDPLRRVMINEFLANPAGTNMDYIELYNHGNQMMDISGCYLSCNPANLTDFRIPDGTFIPARGFIHFLRTTNNEPGHFTFNLAASGESVFYSNANANRVLDAVQFDGQDAGVSTGRYPDGAPTLHELVTQTPSATNSSLLTRDIVINEIMFNSITGSDFDEYVELHNKGTNEINVGKWKLTGIQDGGFEISTGKVIAALGYLVIAKNLANLTSHYSNLNSNNTVGNYAGDLANSGERISLANSNGVVVDEITYSDGGRWGRWADGGGSSLELIDPRSDNRLAGNWSDSDESSKTSTNWQLVEISGYLDLGFTNANGVEVYLGGPGECLVDEVKVLQNGSNHVSNSFFESGTNGWTAQGTHRLSYWETGGGYTNSKSLHVVATGRGDLVNRVRSSLTTNLVTGGTNTATISARVRWLRGSRQIFIRLHGNWLEAAGILILPTNLGSPGAVNSRYITNAPPAIYDVIHSPVLPAPNQIVLVTARAHDPDGIAQLVLKYRVDPSATTTTVTMNDAGTNGDLIAGDGNYAGIIPAQANGVLAAFYLEATDNYSPSATARFPNDAPTRECLVRYGDLPSSGSFAAYRFWLTKANFDAWTSREKASNEALDATFVGGNFRAVYNISALYSGSPYTTDGYDTPNGKFCGYVLNFPEDDRFLGARDFVLDWPIRDETGQREQVAYWMANELGLHYNYRRFIHLFVNGVGMIGRGAIAPHAAWVFEDTQQPNSDALEEWFKDRENGHLYKFDMWLEFNYTNSQREEPSDRYPTMGLFLTTNLTSGAAEKKQARYRAYYRERAVNAGADNLTNLLTLVDTLNTNATGDAYTTAIGAAVDTDQWMRIFAMQDVIDGSDSFGNNGGKNIYAYKPLGETWRLLLWDLDLGLGELNSCGPELTATYPLFYTNDVVVHTLESHPPFQRAYWRGIQEAANGPMLAANVEPILDANYTALNANGVAPLDPGAYGMWNCTTNYTLKGWISQRRGILTNELAKVAAPFEISNYNGNDYTTNNSSLNLVGKAPVEVAIIRFGVATTNAPVSWTSVTNWSISMTLSNGANAITVNGYDRNTNALSGLSDSITVTYQP